MGQVWGWMLRVEVEVIRREDRGLCSLVGKMKMKQADNHHVMGDGMDPL